MTAGPQIWYFLEGGYDVYRLVPSRGWNLFFNLQKMEQSPLYADQEVLVSVFYEDGELYQVTKGGGGWGEDGAQVGTTRRFPPADLPASAPVGISSDPRK